MKLPHRRQFLHLAAGAAALPAVSRVTWAQAYPSRPVRWILGFTSGGNTDIISRLLGQRLSEQLGQPFIIESRPGAGTNIATEAVVRAPADGHTLLFVSASNAINATLYDKLNFNFIHRHQGGVIRSRYSVTPVRRAAAKIAVGTFLPCQPRRAMSVIRGRPADICSMRVLRILTDAVEKVSAKELWN